MSYKLKKITKKMHASEEFWGVRSTFRCTVRNNYEENSDQIGCVEIGANM